jgi:hypothetical protein
MPTLLGEDLFEHGYFAVPGGGGYDEVDLKPLISGVRHAQDPCSMLCTTGVGVDWPFSGTAIGWAAIRFRMNTADESDHTLFGVYDTGWSFPNNAWVDYAISSHTLGLSIGGGTRQSTAMTLDAWHWIELIFDVSGTTWTCYWQVDGVDKTPATQGSHSASTVAHVFAQANGSGAMRFARAMRGSAASSTDWFGIPTLWKPVQDQSTATKIKKTA